MRVSFFPIRHHHVLFASVVLAEKLTTQSRSTPHSCTQHNCSVYVVPAYYHTYKYCKMDLAHIMYHYGFDDGYDTTIASWLLLLFFFRSALCTIFTILHSLIRGVLRQSCSTGAKNFTKCVFYHVQFSGVIQNIAYLCAIFTLFVYVNYYQNNQFY